MVSLLDTNQAEVAKICVGADNECNVLCREISQVLKAYPERVSA